MMSQNHELPDFSGKIVTFYSVNTPPEWAVALVSPSFEKQAGRLFVVGEIAPQVPPHWDDGLHSAIAWDQVSSYVVFDSLEDHQARLAAYDESVQSGPNE